MASVSIRGLEKRFGAFSILNSVDLEFAEGEFVVIVGPSGCGKSTLLRLISGLEKVSGGRIHIGGKDVTEVDAAERGIAMVFQSYALYPHMTVAENMGFGLKMTGMPKAQVEAAVGKAARMLRLEPLLARRPRQLSGGQRQRVAIGRAIVREPGVFLFDEPLSNLDAELRVEMRNELAQLHQDLRSTMVYVTHDQVEAMTLADRIVVMNKGFIEQVGTPMELYGNPRNRFVAGFIGSPKMNFLRVETAGERAFLACAPEADLISLPKGTVVDGETILGIRPEHFDLHRKDHAQIAAKVVLVENLGVTAFVHATTSNGERLVIECRENPPLVGTDITISFDPASSYVFSGSGRLA